MTSEDGSMIIPHAYNTTKKLERKIPVKAKNISFKEQRTKARLDRRMRDRDEGGWAAEWSRNQGDHKYWSKLTSSEWMKKRAQGLQRGSWTASERARANSANPFSKNRPIEPLVWNASYVARSNNPELDQKSRNDLYYSHAGQSNTFEAPEMIQTSLVYKQPIVKTNPALLREAGKPSDLISKERNKKQLFENLEDNNSNIKKKFATKPKTNSKVGARPAQRKPPIRRSYSSNGSRRSSNGINQENALRNSQALLGNSTYEGPPYAYKTSTRPVQDRYGSQYGNFFNFENSLYSNFRNTRKKYGKNRNYRMTGSRVGSYW